MGKTEEGNIHKPEAGIMDKEKKCIRFPAELSITENWVDVSIILEISAELAEQYPLLNFSGRWDFESNVEGKQEYLFFFT